MATLSKPIDFTKLCKVSTKSIPGISTGFNDPKCWVSTGSFLLNKLISGDFSKGIPLGKISVFAGESGCLPENAKVTVRINNDKCTETTIGWLRSLFHSGGDLVELNTPDGFQQITQWFDKGVLPMVRITLESGISTICAANHLVQVFDTDSNDYVWSEAQYTEEGNAVLSVNSQQDRVISVETSEPQECFDFTVDHPNHRYWGDGISSHNSGKSYLCSGNIVKNAQEQGIYVVLIDTENALDEQWLTSLGVDTSPEKLQRVSVAMMDDLAKFTSEFVKSYRQEFDSVDEEERPKVLFVVDSLGMLMTPTETAQFQSGDMKGDMGRGAKQRKAYIMNCVNMFGDLNIGLVMTNHTYESQDMFNPDPKVHGGCLTSDHLITMADGSLKSIDTITTGEMVQTLYGSKKVLETFQFMKPTITINLGDETVECSETHRFLVKKNDEMVWVCANDLNVDDQIICM